MSLSIASYNVLAGAYVRPDRYPRVVPRLLDPSRRTAAVAGRVAGLGADVLCLQEVEPPVLAALAARLEPDGYLPFFAPKGGKPDGCATFVKRASWRVLEWRELSRRRGGRGLGARGGGTPAGT
jgi:mRNA deadenylase 3'-5' endonuclease subunit Ccr4